MMRNVPAVTTKILACSHRNLGRELDVRKNAPLLAQGEVFFLDIPLYRTPLFSPSVWKAIRGVAPAHRRYWPRRVSSPCRRRETRKEQEKRMPIVQREPSIVK